MAFRYRLYPAPAQAPMVERHCADARFVWNLALEQANAWRPGRVGSPGRSERFRQLAEARRETWLGEGSSSVQQQALRDFDQALRNWWGGTHRRPRWRRCARQRKGGHLAGQLGRALVDGEGRVVGINVAYIPPQARAVSIGFAIPSPTVIDAVTELLDDGVVEHPFVGVQIRTLTPDIARRFDIEADGGALLIDVEAGGPAAEAGAEPGDVVVAFDDRQVRSVEDFLGALRGHDPGDRVTLHIRRDGQALSLSVTLGERPPPSDG